MNSRTQRNLVLSLLLVLGIALVGSAQEESAFGGRTPLRLLLVDGTKTFASTARVGALAGAVRASGLFELDVRFTDTACPYDDPLACAVDLPSTPYDLIVSIPRGIDDRTADSVWVVTSILPWTSSTAWPAVAAVTSMIDQVFAGLATAVDPSLDLWPAFTAALYQAQGWLR